MTVRDIAKTFGMDVNQLSSISGYSKQGLYNLVNGKTKVNKKRFTSFLEHLRVISNSQYEQAIAQAKIKKKKREKMLREMIKLIKEDTQNANPAN